MLFHQLLPNLQSYQSEINDRLSRDPANQTLKEFLVIINSILKDHYQVIPHLQKPVEQFIGNISQLDDDQIYNFQILSLEIPEQLQYYIANRKKIDDLRIYLEATSKVKDIGRKFFDDQY